MPAFVFICHDGGDKTALRNRHLLEHLAYAEKMESDILVGGPCRGVAPDAPQYSDSLILLKATDEAEARAMLESDPYFRHGIWASYEMMAFTPVTGTYIGGRTWDVIDGKVVRRPAAKA